MLHNKSLQIVSEHGLFFMQEKNSTFLPSVVQRHVQGHIHSSLSNHYSNKVY